jgi:hypothetical protein
MPEGVAQAVGGGIRAAIARAKAGAGTTRGNPPSPRHSPPPLLTPSCPRRLRHPRDPLPRRPPRHLLSRSRRLQSRPRRRRRLPRVPSGPPGRPSSGSSIEAPGRSPGRARRLPPMAWSTQGSPLPAAGRPAGPAPRRVLRRRLHGPGRGTGCSRRRLPRCALQSGPGRGPRRLDICPQLALVSRQGQVRRRREGAFGDEPRRHPGWAVGSVDRGFAAGNRDPKAQRQRGGSRGRRQGSGAAARPEATLAAVRGAIG